MNFTLSVFRWSSRRRSNRRWMPSGLKASETLKPVPGMADPHHGERAGTLSLHQKRPGILDMAILMRRHVRGILVTKQKGFARCIYGAEEISPAV